MTTSNPTTDKRLRVYRGWSWFSTSATIVRAAYRIDFTPSLRYGHIGFRTAQRGARQPVGKVTP